MGHRPDYGGIKMKKLVSFSAAVLAMVSLGTVAAEAKEEKLTCTLYMGSSMDSAAQSLVTVKGSAVTLMAIVALAAWSSASCRTTTQSRSPESCSAVKIRSE